MDKPRKIANPARCQLNRDFFSFLVPVGAPMIWSRESRPASACSFSTLQRLNLGLTREIPLSFPYIYEAR